MGMTSHAVAHHGVRHVQVFDELGEPGFEVEPVVQDQVRLGSFADIAGCGLVAVDFGPGLGDGLDPELVPGNVLGDVGQHSERCEHHGFVITSRRGIPATGGDPQGKGDAIRTAAKRRTSLARRNEKLGIPKSVAKRGPPGKARLVTWALFPPKHLSIDSLPLTPSPWLSPGLHCLLHVRRVNRGTADARSSFPTRPPRPMPSTRSFMPASEYSRWRPPGGWWAGTSKSWAPGHGSRWAWSPWRSW